MAEQIAVAGEPVLEAKELSRVFGVGRTLVRAVSEVDLVVRRGEVLLIMGPSGSGKTTLLSLFGGLLRPTSGSIRLAGEEIAGMGEGERAALRRSVVGFVFQDFNLLSSLNARENVEIALNIGGKQGRQARERAMAILRELGMGERLEFSPSQLSGGEKQRVALARALANDPQLILADEPTANLDSKHGTAVVELLTRIAREQGRTVVIVSHDYRLESAATRFAWMEDGRLREERDGRRPTAREAPGVARLRLTPITVNASARRSFERVRMFGEAPRQVERELQAESVDIAIDQHGGRDDLNAKS